LTGHGSSTLSCSSLPTERLRLDDWDHCQNIKAFRNARLICSAAKIHRAYNPRPLYYRSYESPILGIEPPFYGCQFELVERVVTIRREYRKPQGVWYRLSSR
jgi:hypothetical protein